MLSDFRRTTHVRQGRIIPNHADYAYVAWRQRGDRYTLVAAGIITGPKTYRSVDVEDVFQ